MKKRRSPGLNPGGAGAWLDLARLRGASGGGGDWLGGCLRISSTTAAYGRSMIATPVLVDRMMAFGSPDRKSPVI